MSYVQRWNQMMDRAEARLNSAAGGSGIHARPAMTDARREALTEAAAGGTGQAPAESGNVVSLTHWVAGRGRWHGSLDPAMESFLIGHNAQTIEADRALREQG